MDAELIPYLEAMEKRLGERIDDTEKRFEARIGDTEKRLVERIDDTEKRLREYIDERTHDSETRIVRAFGAYQDQPRCA